MIIPAGDQSTEEEIAQAIVVFLETCAYGEAPFLGSSGLFFNLPRFIKLTPIDREVSRSRPAELKWHSMVRNAYRKCDGLFVKRRGGGYQLASRVKKKVG